MRVEGDILEEVLSAIDYLMGEEPSAASPCYRQLRLSSWKDMENLRDRVVASLARGPEEPMEMSWLEADLAARVLECADSLRKGVAEERDRAISRTFALTGIAGGILGLVAYLLR